MNRAINRTNNSGVELANYYRNYHLINTCMKYKLNYNTA